MKLWTILISAGIVGMFGLYLVGKAARPDAANRDGDNLEAFRRIPVLDGGRVKPIDTYARTTLRVIGNKEEFEDADEKMLPAIRWFIDVASQKPFDHENPAPPLKERSGTFWSAAVFRIDNDDVLKMLKLKPHSPFRYALKDIYDNYDAFEKEARKAEKVPAAQRDLYQVKLLELREHIVEFAK